MLQNAEGHLPDWLREILVCPECRGDLDWQSNVIRCAECPASFEQDDARVLDLQSPSALSSSRPDWLRRQQEMARGYDELLADREHSILAYNSDYGPLTDLLQRHRGRVVDLGGGNGIARHWLSQDVEYVLLEPSVEWLDEKWRSLADVFPCLGIQPPCVRGVCERLPFDGDSFDGALLLWSLNHTVRPVDALREAARVLRPEGRLLVVLEDMAPSWRDYRTGRCPAWAGEKRGWLGLSVLRWMVTGYPLQSDHVRIRESDLWKEHSLKIRSRAWLGAYLTFELQKVRRR